MLNMAVQGEKFRGDAWAFAQVGWLGQTGAVYPLDGTPSECEPGGYTPLYITIGSYVTDDEGNTHLED